MNIQSLSCSLRRTITDIEHEKRKLRFGIVSSLHAVKYNLSQLIADTVVTPIIKELSATTGRNITFQFGTSTGFFYLLVNGKRFAVLYFPNPATGRVFIKSLNGNEKQCRAQASLKDTNQLIEYLQSPDCRE